MRLRGFAFYRRALGLLRREKIPYLVGGAFALGRYTGVRRDTKDLDLFVRPEDCARALRAARRAGYATWVKAPHWLAKIEYEEFFVDVIFNSGNGLCPVDDGRFLNAPRARVFGVPVELTPVEEMIWSKAFIMERGRYDGADVAHLLRETGAWLDWGRLLERFGKEWPVLLSHLILFRFIYPDHADAVPDQVFEALIERLPEASLHGRRLCRGTLLSFAEYLPDVRRWGYSDARLGVLSQRDIDRWTRTPK